MNNNTNPDANLLYAGRAFYVKFADHTKSDLVFEYENTSQIGATVDNLLKAVNEQNINIVNKDSFKFFSEPMLELNTINEGLSNEDEMLLEFEMFNVTRRDVVSFTDFLKNAKNASTIQKSGNDLPSRKFQLGYLHKIQRDDMFKHPAFDDLYKSWGEADEKKRKEAEGGNYTTPGAYPAAVGSY